jgi:hypothetical protein
MYGPKSQYPEFEICEQQFLHDSKPGGIYLTGQTRSFRYTLPSGVYLRRRRPVQWGEALIRCILISIFVSPCTQRCAVRGMIYTDFLIRSPCLSILRSLSFHNDDRKFWCVYCCHGVFSCLTHPLAKGPIPLGNQKLGYYPMFNLCMYLLAV